MRVEVTVEEAPTEAAEELEGGGGRKEPRAETWAKGIGTRRRAQLVTVGQTGRFPPTVRRVVDTTPDANRLVVVTRNRRSPWSRSQGPTGGDGKGSARHAIPGRRIRRRWRARRSSRSRRRRGGTAPFVNDTAWSDVFPSRSANPPGRREGPRSRKPRRGDEQAGAGRVRERERLQARSRSGSHREARAPGEFANRLVVVTVSRSQVGRTAFQPEGGGTGKGRVRRRDEGGGDAAEHGQIVVTLDPGRPVGRPPGRRRPSTVRWRSRWRKAEPPKESRRVEVAGAAGGDGGEGLRRGGSRLAADEEAGPWETDPAESWPPTGGGAEAGRGQETVPNWAFWANRLVVVTEVPVASANERPWATSCRWRSGCRPWRSRWWRNRLTTSLRKRRRTRGPTRTG